MMVIVAINKVMPPAGNAAADDEYDGYDGNGEGKINDKGDCDIDCNKAEC